MAFHSGFNANTIADAPPIDAYANYRGLNYALHVPKRQKDMFAYSDDIWVLHNQAAFIQSRQTPHAVVSGALSPDTVAPFVALVTLQNGETSAYVGDQCRVFQSGDAFLFDGLKRQWHGFHGDCHRQTVILPRSCTGWPHEWFEELRYFPRETPAAIAIGRQVAVMFELLNAGHTETTAILLPGLIAALETVLTGRESARAPESQAALKLATIKSHIRRNSHRATLTVDRLCREFAMSRAVLYRLFEPEGGVSHYIMSCRVEAAYTRLNLDTLRRGMIGDIAEDTGFCDTSHLTNNFLERFGMLPTDILQLRREAPRTKTAPAANDRRPVSNGALSPFVELIDEALYRS